MKKYTLNKGVIFLSLFFIIAIGSYAYAGWGQGQGQGRGNGNEMGYGHGGGNGCPGSNGQNYLTDEQRKNLQSLRQNFIAQTKDIRENFYNKQGELNAEFNLDNPDKDKLILIQKEVSELKNQLSEKRILFKLEAKKIDPNIGIGRGKHRGRGHRGGCRGLNCN